MRWKRSCGPAYLPDQGRGVAWMIRNAGHAAEGVVDTGDRFILAVVGYQPSPDYPQSKLQCDILRPAVQQRPEVEFTLVPNIAGAMLLDRVRHQQPPTPRWWIFDRHI